MRVIHSRPCNHAYRIVEAYFSYFIAQKLTQLFLSRCIHMIYVLKLLLLFAIFSSSLFHRHISCVARARAIVGIVINVGSVAAGFFFIRAQRIANSICIRWIIISIGLWILRIGISRVAIRAGASSSFSVRAIACWSIVPSNKWIRLSGLRGMREKEMVHACVRVRKRKTERWRTRLGAEDEERRRSRGWFMADGAEAFSLRNFRQFRFVLPRRGSSVSGF